MSFIGILGVIVGIFIWSIGNLIRNDSEKFSLEINDRQIEIRIQPPYLFGGIFIPLFPETYSNKLWRKAKKK